jgi:hypothetical protein
VRQTCSDGSWVDAEPCSAALGCFDPDSADGPQAYCGVCAAGDKRCGAGLEACAAGQWAPASDCSATSGWSCFDPAPPGGTDAYCGLCLINGFACHGDSRDQCNAQGTAFAPVETCGSGCDPATSACCAPPSCGARECGPSPTNACGRAISCGSCPPNQRCVAGTCELNG